MNLTALIMMALTQGLVTAATGYFLYRVLSSPSNTKNLDQ